MLYSMVIYISITLLTLFCNSRNWNFIKYKSNLLELSNNQIKLHPLYFFLFTIGLAFDFITILIASSNMALSPSCVKALHSIYLH